MPVITVKECSLLVAVQRVVSGIEIQDELPALSPKGLDAFFD